MKVSSYSENWADTVRPCILKRDNYKCKKCSVKHRSIGYYNNVNNFVECDSFMVDWCKRNNLKVIRVILQVHHKNGNKKDDTDNNLISLCPRCHFKEEKELNIIKRKLKGIVYR